MRRLIIALALLSLCHGVRGSEGQPTTHGAHTTHAIETARTARAFQPRGKLQSAVIRPSHRQQQQQQYLEQQYQYRQQQQQQQQQLDQYQQQYQKPQDEQQDHSQQQQQQQQQYLEQYLQQQQYRQQQQQQQKQYRPKQQQSQDQQQYQHLQDQQQLQAQHQQQQQPQQQQQQYYQVQPYSALPSHIRQLLYQANEPLSGPYVDPRAFLYQIPAAQNAEYEQQQEQQQHLAAESRNSYRVPKEQPQYREAPRSDAKTGGIRYKGEAEEEQQPAAQGAPPTSGTDKIHQLLLYQAQIPYNVIANHILYRPKTLFVPMHPFEEGKGPYYYRSKVYYVRDGAVEEEGATSAKPVKEE